jgi:CRISPR-associated protein Csx16
MQMPTYLVTRHRGAIDWAHRQGLVFQHLAHLGDLAVIKPGDWIIGPLPVGKIADIIAAGARYSAIDMDMLPESARGPELSADDMERYGARLVEYRVERVDSAGSAASDRRW